MAYTTFRLALAFAMCLVCISNSSAGLVKWTAELNRNGTVAIDNQSLGAFNIKSITIDLTATAGGITLNSTNAVMHTLGVEGSFNTVISDPTLIDFTAPGGLSNDLPFIKSTIGAAGNLFTFNFAPGTFSSGEGWGIDNVVFQKPGGGNVSRAEMSGGKISVSFWELPIPYEAVYVTSPANGGSFPLQLTAVPEPSSLTICSVVAMAVGSIGLRRRK